MRNKEGGECMADIKWIKIITNIFEDEKIKLVKSMPEGRTLVLIWFQLLIQAGKTNAAGWIYLSEGCAYTPAMFATLFNESQQMIELALNLFSSKAFELIEISHDGMIYIPNWEKHQNVEGMDKIREQNRIRKNNQRERQKLLLSRDSHVTSQQSHATDIDKELDIDKEIKKDNTRANRFTPPSLNDVQAYCDERNNGINAAKWFNHYTANGWKVGRNQMKDWKAAVRTWEQNNANGGGKNEVNRGRTENPYAGVDFGF
jgi:predicted phage replisome organizer